MNQGVGTPPKQKKRSVLKGPAFDTVRWKRTLHVVMRDCTRRNARVPIQLAGARKRNAQPLLPKWTMYRYVLWGEGWYSVYVESEGLEFFHDAQGKTESVTVRTQKGLGNGRT